MSEIVGENHIDILRLESQFDDCNLTQIILLSCLGFLFGKYIIVHLDEVLERLAIVQVTVCPKQLQVEVSLAELAQMEHRALVHVAQTLTA